MKKISLKNLSISTIAIATALGSLLVGFWLHSFMYTTTSEVAINTASADATLVQAVNEYRASNALPALRQDARLDTSAQVRANEIAAAGKSAWSHTRPNGTSWETTLYSTTDYVVGGENLVECAQSNRDAVNTWKGSKLHNDNMLGRLNGSIKDWQDIGSGRAWDATNNCMVFVTHYGRK